MTRWHVLYVEDQVLDAGFLQEALLSVHRSVHRSEPSADPGEPPTWHVVRTREQFEMALSQRTSDAVLCGTGLNELTPLQALARIKQVLPDTPVLLLSQDTSAEQAQAGLEAGADDHVSMSQPWRLRAALRHLLTALERRALDKERRAQALLVDAAQQLSLARRMDDVMAIVRRCARAMIGSDGATFVLRDGEMCWYVDEDAIGPLWKGSRFPMDMCIGGWAMRHRQPVVIPDVFSDERVSREVYSATFVKSLLMVPIRTREPIGAIGSYWSHPHEASDSEVALMQALADTASVAIDNVRLYAEMEQRVRDRTAELAEANEELEAFSYSVSHDLRAPLRAIDGYAALLGDDKADQLDDEMRQFLAAIRTSAKQMGALIDDLLELSRVSRAPVSRRSVDVSVMATAILAQLQAREPQRSVLSDVAPGIVLQGDQGLLQRALENLLSNAWKYSAKTAAARITLQPWQDSALGEAGFCIADNGAGFDMARAARLFEPFSRLHAATEFSGTGIGLTIVRRVVRRHHGRVWAESARGEGARFYVALPHAGAG